MGALNGSFTKGKGNLAGMLGEILIHKIAGGKRVGHKCFAYDLILDNGLTVDVKTAVGNVEPKPHYVARVYGSEAKKEHLSSKCDVYYFVRADVAICNAWVVGWMWADEFMAKATFLPKGHVNADDGKLAYHDEYSVPISELNPPSMPVEPRVKKAKQARKA